MGEKKKGIKTKMMMVTLVGLGIIAVGAKIVQLVQEKMNNKKQDNHEDCCG